MADKLDAFDVERLESAVNASATRVSAIWISFLVFSLYLLIAATTVTQRQLLVADPIKLPVLNIDLPLWGFFFLAPILFVTLHIYVLLQVLLLGRTAGAYNAAISRAGLSPEENMSVRQRLANTLFAQIFAGSPREREGFIGSLLRAIVWITLGIAPILIVLAFQFSFLAYHSHIATWTHRLLILLELAAFFVIWPLALDAQKDFQWPKARADLEHLGTSTWRLLKLKEKWRRKRLWVRHQAAPLTACLLFVIVSLSIATFPGEPHVNLFTLKPLLSVQCDRWLQQKRGRIDLRFDRLDLPQVDVIDSDKLAKIAERASELKLLPNQGDWTRNFRDRDFNCSDLSSADLRRVDLTGARLVGASLNFAAFDGAALDGAQLQDASLKDARLQGASLEDAQLQGASLRDAGLQGALLLRAQLQRTNLYGAQLQGAFLGSAELQGAFLDRAQLQGASLDSAQLQGAFLDHAQLQGASLVGAQLQGALLDLAQLQGASLVSANLQGASLDKAQLQGADLLNANLDHSVLSNVWIWRARNAACMMARVTGQNSDNVIDSGIDPGSAYDAAIDPRTMVEARNGPIPTTPDAVARFIERSVIQIPDSVLKLKEVVAARMNESLLVNPATDDTAAISQMWSNCEASTSKTPQAQFDAEHATMLRDLACDATQSRAAIAAGIVGIWIGYTDERRAFSAQLAIGLLGQDGKKCPATKDFNEAFENELRAAAAKAIPPAAPAK